MPCQRTGTTDDIPAVPLGEDDLDSFGRFEPVAVIGEIDPSVDVGGDDLLSR